MAPGGRTALPGVGASEQHVLGQLFGGHCGLARITPWSRPQGLGREAGTEVLLRSSLGAGEPAHLGNARVYTGTGIPARAPGSAPEPSLRGHSKMSLRTLLPPPSRMRLVRVSGSSGGRRLGSYLGFESQFANLLS